MSLAMHGMDHLQATLARMQQAHKRGVARGATYLKSVAQVYPSVRRQHQFFVSDRQRRGFFAKLRSGEISVPYQRTGGLGKRWTIQFSDGGNRAIVGNNTPGGEFVMGRDRQAVYHKGNWKTDEEIARNEAPKVRDIFADEYRSAING